MMDFFRFLIFRFFFHFIAFGFSPSGLCYDGYFFFDLGLLLPFYCLSFKSVRFRVWCFCFFLIWRCLFHFIAFGFKPSGLGYDRFFFLLRFLASFSIFLPFFKSVRFKLWWFSLVFDLGLVFQFYCLWFKSVEFGYDGFFLFFWFGATSSILLPLV